MSKFLMTIRGEFEANDSIEARAICKEKILALVHIPYEDLKDFINNIPYDIKLQKINDRKPPEKIPLYSESKENAS